jgi:hypothetical protein
MIDVLVVCYLWARDSLHLPRRGFYFVDELTSSYLDVERSIPLTPYVCQKGARQLPHAITQRIIATLGDSGHALPVTGEPSC